MRITSAHSSRRLWAALAAASLSLIGVTAVAPATAAPAAPAVAPYGAYVPVSPARVLDTRSNFGTTHVGPVGAGQLVTTLLASRGGLPVAANISAVVVNLTATAPTTEARKMRFIARLSMIDQQARTRHPLHTACLTYGRPFFRQCSSGVRDGRQVPEEFTAFASGRFLVR